MIMLIAGDDIGKPIIIAPAPSGGKMSLVFCICNSDQIRHNSARTNNRRELISKFKGGERAYHCPQRQHQILDILFLCKDETFPK